MFLLGGAQNSCTTNGNLIFFLFFLIRLQISIHWTTTAPTTANNKQSLMNSSVDLPSFASQINKWAEIFNLPFELWYFHPQVAQFNEKEFAKFFRSLGNVANTAAEDMINQRNVLWRRESRFEVHLRLSYLRRQSMAAKYEFMKVILGPSHGIHSPERT